MVSSTLHWLVVGFKVRTARPASTKSERRERDWVTLFDHIPSIAVDKGHAGFFRACISDLLLYASPFDDVDGV